MLLMEPVQFMESVCKSIISTSSCIIRLEIDLQATSEVDLYFSNRFSEVSRKASGFYIPT